MSFGGVYSATMNSPQDILEHVFGYTQFRSPQAEVIDTLMAGRDALVLIAAVAVRPIHYPKELLTAMDVLAVELWVYHRRLE